MQVQLDYSIMACTIPCLKPFMVACNTGWGSALTRTSRASTLKSSSYVLKSLQRNLGRKNAALSDPGLTADRSQQNDGHGGDDDNKIAPKQRDDRTEGGGVADPNHRDPIGADETAQSVASNDSTQMIIRREVVWSVTYEDEHPGESGNLHHSNQDRMNNREDIEAQTPPSTL